MTDDNFGGRGEDFIKFQAALPRRFGERAVTSWMSDLRPERITEDSVILSTESQVKCDTLGQRFVMQMRDAWSEEVRPIRRMTVVKRNRLSASAARVDGMTPQDKGALLDGGAAARNSANVSPGGAKAPFNLAGIAKRSREDARPNALEEILSPLDERATFDRFAVDDSNRVAYAAARHVFVKEAPAEVIYIHGPSGIGKTHLLHAVGNQWKSLYGDGGCAYLTYHNITSGCADAAFKNGGLHALHKELLAREVVLIDDIHLLVGAVRTQIEILNLVNASLASGKRLVIAGELAPTKLAEGGINERLADRLSGGISVAMAPGGAALRGEVLKKRLEVATTKCSVTDEAVDYIATQFPQSMREALGALIQLLLVYGGETMTVGLNEAGAALRARLVDRRRTPTLEEAAVESAKTFEITIEELKGRGQPQRLARARHAFVWIGREVLRESFPRIAKTLGRDHTTSMSGYHRALALLERDKKFQTQVKAIRTALGQPGD
ncbi:MAG: DnaA/Hda family protein [Parvularculaceae bacterium]